MATTTPNYGWAVPTSTDLVKDGATAIETLGDAIDASMNTALGTKKAGMVLLNTTSFSGVTSVSLPASTFTTTYDRYLIKGNLSCSNAAVDINGRLRTAGTDNSGTIYNFQYITAGGTGTGAGRATSQNLISGMGGYYATAGRDNSDINIEIRKPAQTDYTLGYYQYPTVSEGSIGYIAYYFGTTGTTSFDSLSLIASAGTITGTIYCYAYND
jgi:hypothetical protein